MRVRDNKRMIKRTKAKVKEEVVLRREEENWEKKKGYKRENEGKQKEKQEK